MLLCDRCEREYHVQCIAQRSGTQPLQALPVGTWYCCDECTRVAAALQASLEAGPVPLGAGYSVAVLRGGIAPPKTMRAALAVVQECFHPIVDYRTRADLVPLIVTSQRTANADFTGFTTHTLRFGETTLCVATVRLLGADVAEMPLVGTSFKYRQQGLCRRLVRLVEEALYGMNVRRLVLPAVPDIEATWVKSFGFSHCSIEQRRSLSG
jgi:N-acetylglutamate synthase-like GNAT family acetyltransferase